MNRHCFPAVLCVLALVSGATLADDRITGHIFGVVTDTDGGALPGATVILEGEGLIQREITAVTTERGNFRFRNLTPGDYIVTIELDGFEAQAIGVAVNVGKTATVETQLSLGTVAETLEVTSEAPLIDKQSASVVASFEAEFIKAVPLGREFGAIADLTPGVTDGGAAFGGGGMEDSSSRRRGSASNSYRLNGVDVSDPNWGNTWVNPSVDTIAEVEVVGLGASAEYGSFTGATVNIVTKSGTNAYHGAGSVYFTDDALWSDNSDGEEDLIHAAVQDHWDLSASLGGPIIREKLLFFGNIGYESRNEIPYLLTQGEEISRTRYHLRLDWLVNEKNIVNLMTNSDPRTDRNLGLMSGAGPEIAYGVDFGSNTWLVGWQSTLSDSAFLDLRYAGYRGKEEYLPIVCCDLPSVWDSSTGLIYGTSGWNGTEENQRDEANATFSYYADEFLGATHAFKFGIEYEQTSSDYEYKYAGSYYGSIFLYPYDYPEYSYTYLGGYTYYSHLNGEVERYTAYAQDDIRVSEKLSLNLGLRYDHPKISDTHSPPGVPGGELAQWDSWAPRLGLSFDLSGKGTSVLHASAGRYYEKAMTYSVLGGAGNTYETLDYFLTFIPGLVDLDNIDFRGLEETIFQPENLWFSFVPEPIDVDPGVTGPYSDVFNLGYQLQLRNDLVISADLVYKQDRDFIVWEDRTNHSYAPFEYVDRFGVSHIFYEQADDLPQDWWITNNDYYYRDNAFVILGLKKRRTNRLNFFTSLTYQKSEGNIDNALQTNWGVGAYNEHKSPNFLGNPTWDGLVSYNRTWQFKAMVGYEFAWGINVSGVLQAMTGRPWESKLRASAVPNFADPFVTFKGILLEQRGSQEMDSMETLDLRVEKVFVLGGRATSLNLFVDVFNVFNNSGWLDVYDFTNNVYPISGEDAFGQPALLIPPRRARLGLRIDF